MGQITENMYVILMPSQRFKLAPSKVFTCGKAVGHIKDHARLSRE